MYGFSSRILSLTLIGLLACNIITTFAWGTLAWGRSSRATRIIDPARPLPEGWEKEHCEPIRQNLVALNRHRYLIHFFLRPRIGYLTNRYYSCLEYGLDRQFFYMKQTETQIKPQVRP